MAITLHPPTVDAQGLPVVTWDENRNHHAPGSNPSRVCCFIHPDPNGVLNFVRVDVLHDGKYIRQEARSWEHLASFSVENADNLYHSAADRALINAFASRTRAGPWLQLAAMDGALVTLANFLDNRRSVPMHVNRADCLPVEAATLHDRLRFEFIDRRLDLINDKCGGSFSWPKTRPFVMHRAPAPQYMTSGGCFGILLIVALLGLSVWGVYRWVVSPYISHYIDTPDDCLVYGDRDNPITSRCMEEYYGHVRAYGTGHMLFDRYNK